MLYGRFIEMKSNLRRKKFHKTNKGSNFLGGSFSNRDNERDPIQFRKEKEPQDLERWFFPKTDPSKQNKLNFPALKSISHLLS